MRISPSPTCWLSTNDWVNECVPYTHLYIYVCVCECLCACVWILSYAVYKCLLITTFNFKARAPQTNWGPCCCVCNIEYCSFTYIHTRRHTYVRTYRGTFAPIHCRSAYLVSGCEAPLFARRSLPQTVNWFAAHAAKSVPPCEKFRLFLKSLILAGIQTAADADPPPLINLSRTT